MNQNNPSQNRPPRLLIVEDHEETAEYLTEIFAGNGYDVVRVPTGATAKQKLLESDFDVLILDLGLPDISGVSVLAEVRQHSELGVIVLSAQSEQETRLICLELGADDYIEKPFQNRELIARTQQLIKRLSTSASDRPTFDAACRFDTFVLYPYRRVLRDRDSRIVSLSGTEFALLETFVNHPRQVLSRTDLLAKAYGEEVAISERAIDVHINRIRRKIEVDPKHPRILKTVRHKGYIFAADVHRGEAS